MKPETLKEYAKRIGISYRTAKRRAAAGLPLGDGDRCPILTPGHSHDSGTYSNLSLDEARRRRHVVNWQREELEFRRTKGDLLDKGDIEEAGIRIGASLGAHLGLLIQDSPGLLAGLSEAEIERQLATRLESIKASLRAEIKAVTATCHPHG